MPQATAWIGDEIYLPMSFLTKLVDEGGRFEIDVSKSGNGVAAFLPVFSSIESARAAYPRVSIFVLRWKQDIGLYALQGDPFPPSIADA